MRLIFISGAYTNSDPWEARMNIVRAESWGYEVMKLGAWPVIPHSNTAHHFTGACTYEAALEGTMEMMRRCDAGLWIPGWTDSKGARLEWDEAAKIGLPRLHSIGEVRLWLLEQTGAAQ